MKVFKQRASGQGMVEFVLVVMVLLIVAFGAFEVGRAVLVQQAIVSASREAARVGSSADNYLDCSMIRDRAMQVGAIANVAVGDVLIYYAHGVPEKNSSPPPEYIDPLYVGQSVETDPKTECGMVVTNGEEEEIVSGDRIEVEVTGYFKPAGVLSWVGFNPFSFTATTRRTIFFGFEID